MKPEYKFNVEGLVNKEKVLSGLMESGYIVSCKSRVGGWEISVYGKERLDGQGHKQTEWFEKMDKPKVEDMITKTPYYPPTVAYFGTNSITTPAYVATVTNCSSVEDKTKEIETIVKAIEHNYGC